MSRSDHLTVWLGDVAVATVQPSSGDRILLRYSDAALDTWTINQPVLSCALLLGTGTLDAVPFIDGLLPEGDTRRSANSSTGSTAIRWRSSTNQN